MELEMTGPELEVFLSDVFPQAAHQFQIIEVEPMKAKIRLIVAHEHLRPGGTISGPAMFALADVAMYIAILGMIGPKALAVTTNLSIDFMRKPDGTKDMYAICTLHKLGKSLAVGDVLIYSGDADKAVARASATYSIPQNPKYQGNG